MASAEPKRLDTIGREAGAEYDSAHLQALEPVTRNVIEQVCEDARWHAECDEAYINLNYAGEDYNRIVVTVRSLHKTWDNTGHGSR